MSADPENEYFSDGLTEELLNVLARNPGLKVTGRTSSFAFKGKQDDLRVIGQKLGVSSILEGSVRKAGNRVRITAQLVKVSDGFHIWSDTYDRVLDDIFAVQDDIAQSVAKALDVTLLGKAPTRQVRNAEAYNLVLQAHHFAQQNSEVALEKAGELFRQALELDAEDARAWAGLASVYLHQAAFGTGDMDECIRGARESTLRALAVDDGSAEAHNSMAWIRLIFDHDWSGAKAEMESALSMVPHNSLNLTMLAFCIASAESVEEALPLVHRALEIDPLSPAAYFNLGRFLWWADRCEEARETFRKVKALSPDYTSIHTRLGLTYLTEERPQEALAEMQAEVSRGYRSFGLALAHHALSDRSQADQAFKELLDLRESWAFQIACVYAYRGEVDSAFKWLDIALTRYDPGLPAANRVPLLAGLRSDARWPAFLRKLGLPA
jgi:TolB-like protein/thioredoxin-like negative regulator of GroEL